MATKKGTNTKTRQLLREDIRNAIKLGVVMGLLGLHNFYLGDTKGGKRHLKLDLASVILHMVYGVIMAFDIFNCDNSFTCAPNFAMSIIAAAPIMFSFALAIGEIINLFQNYSSYPEHPEDKNLPKGFTKYPF